MINWVEDLANITKNDTCQFSLIHTIRQIIARLNPRRDSRVERAETRLEFRENRIDFQIVIKLLKNFSLENFIYYWQEWNGSIISHITAVIAFIDRAHTCIFSVINKNYRAEWQIKYKVKDGAIILLTILRTLAGILSRPVLFDTFKFFNVSATFSTGILENRKVGKLFWMLLRYVLMLLEDLFVDSPAKVGSTFTKKSLKDSEICWSSETILSLKRISLSGEDTKIKEA